MRDTADHGSHGRARTNTEPAPFAPLREEATTAAILNGFFAVYRGLGSGFVEGVYASALALELTALGLRIDAEVPVSVFYRGVEVGRFRADLIVNGVVLVELKAADRI